MTYIERLKNCQEGHDLFASHRFNRENEISLINEFHRWHSSTSALFSELINDNDSDFQVFKSVQEGNAYVLESEFSRIDSSFAILLSKAYKSAQVLLEGLIIEGKDIRSSIRYVQPPSGIIRTYSVYSLQDNGKYEEWKNRCMRFLSTKMKGDRAINDFEAAAKRFSDNNNSPKEMDNMIGILSACVEFPSLQPITSLNDSSQGSGVIINVSQNQSQNQTQSSNIFLEAIKDELTGRELKEIKEILKENSNPLTIKGKVLEKLKSFGIDTLSTIITNIILNPTIWR